MSGDVCTDNRFEMIEKYKRKLIEGTNIETSADEMAVLDNILFRFWQMGWLDQKASSSCSQENDSISRRAAIDEATRLFEMGDCYCDRASIVGMLNSLPPTQPERKPGEWIYDGDCYICNQCKSAFNWWADSQTSNFCPNCGADMRKEERRE